MVKIKLKKPIPTMIGINIPKTTEMDVPERIAERLVPLYARYVKIVEPEPEPEPQFMAPEPLDPEEIEPSS